MGSALCSLVSFSMNTLYSSVLDAIFITKLVELNSQAHRHIKSYKNKI